MISGRPETLKTCHHAPWALITRGGVVAGQRQRTRMAFLVGTVAPNGQAVAVTGYILDDSLRNWTKHPRRIEWRDIVRQWPKQPDSAAIKKVRLAMKPPAVTSHQPA